MIGVLISRVISILVSQMISPVIDVPLIQRRPGKGSPVGDGDSTPVCIA